MEEINRRGYTNRNMNFWIGLTDLGSEGYWWLASNGLNWHANQPNNRGLIEHCARIRIRPSSYWKDTWSDINCRNKRVSVRLNTYTIYPSTGFVVYDYYEYSMHTVCEFSQQEELSAANDPSTEGRSTHTLFP